MQLSQMLVGVSLLLALALPFGAPAAVAPAAAAPAQDAAAVAPAAATPAEIGGHLHKRQAEPLDLQRLAAEPRRKRPFCNAFTGCGKKRADESLGTLLELNSEPAVAELSRQILSEAKLWEAIQEARAELLRRRQQQLQTNHVMPEGPLPLPLTGLRKRRAAPAAAPAAPAAALAAPGPQAPAAWLR